MVKVKSFLVLPFFQKRCEPHRQKGKIFYSLPFGLCMQRTFILRIQLYMGKVLNSLCSSIDNKLIAGKVLGSPKYIQVETTNRCNLKCIACPNSSNEFYKDKSLQDLTLQEFKQIIGNFPFLERVSLQGLGEPTINKQLPEIVSYCTSKGISAGFVTNGTLLTKELSKKLIEGGLSWLVVSVDGSSEETYRSIRTGNLPKIISNLKVLIATKKELHAQIPDISIMLVGMKSNINEVLGVVNIAKEIGISNVTVKGLYTKHDEKLNSEVLDKEDIITLEKYKSEAEHMGINLAIAVQANTSKRALRCRWPWMSAYVTVTGDIMPCCYISDINMGNIFTESFESIWNSTNYREFRKSLKNGTAPTCESCTDY